MKMDAVVSAASATIVVIGGGLAGLSASLEAVRHAAACHAALRVLVLEKSPALGGNSAKASSGLSALTAASNDTEALFLSDTIRSGGGLSNESLVRKLVHESEDALAFLKGFGVDLSKLSQCGAHSVVRTHRNERGPNVGFAIMSALTAAAANDEAIEIVTGARVHELLHEGQLDGLVPQAVRGVAYSLQHGAGGGGDGACTTAVAVEADAVVLATGGFAASAEQLGRWAPNLRALPTTNSECATGDGVLLGLELGASTVDLEQVQVHPTAIVDPAHPDARTKWLAPEALRGSGGVLLDAAGRRFVDELEKRSVVTRAMFALPSKGHARLVLGEVAAAAFGLPTLAFYEKRGLVAQHDGFAGLAEHLGVPETTLRDEAGKYDAAAAHGKDPLTGKTVFPSPFGRAAGEAAESNGGTFFSLIVTPALHYCMGGLRIGESAEVLRELADADPDAHGGARFAPIRGLYAAGEVTGGVHGQNRLAGNSLLECVVFGRAAGRAAVDAAIRRLAERTRDGTPPPGA